MGAREWVSPAVLRDVRSRGALLDRGDSVRVPGVALNERPAAGLGDEVRALVGARRDLDERLMEAVRVMREQGASWGEVGRALGVSQQAAHRMYAGRVAS